MKKEYILIKNRIEESIQLKRSLIDSDEIIYALFDLATEMINCLKRGNKIVLCGNGGSASDALHFAGEIVGRFQRERNAWPAVVLNADVVTMTAIANDYGYKDIFARQAQGHVNKGDIFIGISTSGNSENVVRAGRVAKKQGALTAALLGKNGGKIAKEVDISIVVNSDITARIQEVHIMMIHILCELIENGMSNE